MQKKDEDFFKVENFYELNLNRTTENDDNKNEKELKVLNNSNLNWGPCIVVWIEVHINFHFLLYFFSFLMLS